MADSAASHGHNHQHDHQHDHDHGDELHSSAVVCCSHHEEASSERNLVLYFVGGMLLIATRLGDWLGVANELVTQIPAMIAALLLAIPMARTAWKELITARLSSSTLAFMAIAAAAANQSYETAGWLAFILLVADAILRRTAFGAQRAIEELVQLTPDTARQISPTGEETIVALNQIAVGDIVRVRPGENLPVDGTVTSGRSMINQASLTGEAAPVEVEQGSEVYAGTTNLTGTIDLRTTLIGEQTTIGRVSQLIREAEGSRTSRQAMIEQVARFFVPVALSVAAVTWFVMSQSGDELNRARATETAITVLVVCCPASLLLASPSAMVAAFASAARLGVLIKDSKHLETAAGVDAVVMDKTGTITTGRFEVSKLAPAQGVEGAALLQSAADGDQHSNHPLAESILRTARQARIQPEASEQYEEVHGRGVRAVTAKGEVRVGRASWLMELNPQIRPLVEDVERRIEGMTGVHVMLDSRYLGAVGLEDKIKPKTGEIVTRMRELGIRTVAIFTGDRMSVAERVGRVIGADAVEAECLPEEKHEQIRMLRDQGYRTMMVGDGINDGPSLAEADVGVAMGLSGSDIAANSAGIALMTDELNRIPFLIELSRKTRAIVAQNIAASILIVLVGLFLAATGNLAVPAAALYHFAGEIFVLGNSFRLFRFGEDFTEAESAAKAAEAQRQARTRRAASVRGLQTQAV